MAELLSHDALVAAGARKIQPNYDMPCERRDRTCVTHDSPRTPARFSNELSVKCSAVRTATRMAGDIVETILPLIDAENQRLREALAFYADPDTYFAIAFWPDPPCGDFIEDFSEDHGDPFYNRAMPGRTARDALQWTEEVERD